MKILSIDPGYERIGIAILEKNGSDKEILLHSECFKTSSKIPHDERLLLIGEKIKILIEHWRPQILAIEKLFFNTNQKTALLVAEARGVVLYEARVAQLSVYEYTPLQVKIAVTGYGRSEKRQMMIMIPKLLEIKNKIKSDDEFDAIAIGLTCLASDFKKIEGVEKSVIKPLQKK